MSKFSVLCIALLALVAGIAGADPAMGNWQGTINEANWEKAALTAEVIGTGRDSYRVDLHVASDGAALADTQLQGIKDDDTAVFVGHVDLGEANGGKYRVVATAVDGAMSGTLTPADNKPLAFTMKRVYKKSPTLGIAPPKDAIVLMDGSNLNAWNLVPGNLIDGALQIGSSNFVSKREFGDHKMHLEFRTPYMPDRTGQGRGNSGVYIQGRYEVQVLDSFGEAPADNQCGGIYSISAPAVEADLPPGEWQTYDIEFHAPKFNAKGEKVQNARITVLHNGLVIHDNLELDHVTPGGVSGTEAAKGPLMLQDHENRVQYRNIWIRPLK